MEHLSVKVERSGRVLIPAAVRRELGIAEGSELLLRVEDGGVRMETRAQAVSRVQERFKKYARPGVMLSEELLKGRREEALRADR
jgi:AbrB family looped-hinge helix DNA binding protein